MSFILLAPNVCKWVHDFQTSRYVCFFELHLSAKSFFTFHYKNKSKTLIYLPVYVHICIQLGVNKTHQRVSSFHNDIFFYYVYTICKYLYVYTYEYLIKPRTFIGRRCTVGTQRDMRAKQGVIRPNLIFVSVPWIIALQTVIIPAGNVLYRTGLEPWRVVRRYNIRRNPSMRTLSVLSHTQTNKITQYKIIMFVCVFYPSLYTFIQSQGSVELV